MASRDIKRLNPGIQVDKLYVGAASKVNPYLVPETSEVTIDTSTFKVGTAEQDLDPTPFPFDSTSGSILVLGDDALGVKAIDFDGSNEFLDLATNSDFDFNYSSSYSLSVWLKTTQTAAGTPISKMDSADSYRGWDIRLKDGLISAHLKHAWDSSAIKVTTILLVNDNLFHNVIVTYDGSTDASGMTIYVDNTSESLTINMDTLGNDDTTNSIDINIGRREYGNYFDGYVGHVSVWNKELNQSEVTEIYNSGTPAGFNLSGSHSASGSLIGWWKTGDGDDGAGTDDSTAAGGYIYDMSANSHNMAANNMEAGDIDDV